MLVCLNSHSKSYSHSVTSDGGRSQCSSSCSYTCCTGTTTTTTTTTGDRCGGGGGGGGSNISQGERFVLSVTVLEAVHVDIFLSKHLKLNHVKLNQLKFTQQLFLK